MTGAEKKNVRKCAEDELECVMRFHLLLLCTRERHTFVNIK